MTDGSVRGRLGAGVGASSDGHDATVSEPSGGAFRRSRVQFGKYVQRSPDVQCIWNPGYNRDRGPATVLGLRLNVRY